METLQDEIQLETAISSSPVLVVQYGSATCGPCHAIRQKLEIWNQQADYAHLLYIPLDRFPALAAQAGIFTVPAIQVYIRGKLFLQESGYFSLEDILNKIQSYWDLYLS